MQPRDPTSAASAHLLVVAVQALLTGRECELARGGACRGWSVLPAAAKLQLVDSLCSNLSVLATSASAAAAGGGDADAAVLKAHRTALKVYFFFLHWVASTAEADAASASASAAAVAPTKVRRGQHWLPSPRGVCVRSAKTETTRSRVVSRSTLTHVPWRAFAGQGQDEQEGGGDAQHVRLGRGARQGGAAAGGVDGHGPHAHLPWVHC